MSQTQIRKPAQTPQPVQAPSPQSSLQEDILSYIPVKYNPVLWSEKLPSDWRKVTPELVEKASRLAEAIADARVKRKKVTFKDAWSIASQIDPEHSKELVEYAEKVGTIAWEVSNAFVGLGRRIHVNIELRKDGWLFVAKISAPVPIHVKTAEVVKKVKANIVKIIRDSGIVEKDASIKPILEQLSESDITDLRYWMDSARNTADLLNFDHWQNNVTKVYLDGNASIKILVQRPDGKWRVAEFTLKGWSEFKNRYLQ